MVRPCSGMKKKYQKLKIEMRNITFQQLSFATLNGIWKKKHKNYFSLSGKSSIFWYLLLLLYLLYLVFIVAIVFTVDLIICNACRKFKMAESYLLCLSEWILIRPKTLSQYLDIGTSSDYLKKNVADTSNWNNLWEAGQNFWRKAKNVENHRK